MTESCWGSGSSAASLPKAVVTSPASMCLRGRSQYSQTRSLFGVGPRPAKVYAIDTCPRQARAAEDAQERVRRREDL